MVAQCCGVMWRGVCSQTLCSTVLSFVVVVPLQNGFTPLSFAAQEGHIEVVHALVAAGASVNKARNVGGIAGS